MDIFFQEPDAIPLPPADVRIKRLEAEPWPDGRRVRVRLELTPFQQRPNAELIIADQDGQEAASISIIESMDRMIELTMHLRGLAPRGLAPRGLYRLSAVVFYREAPPPSGAESESPAEIDLAQGEPIVVDRAQVEFSLPAPE
jgi:hypothetical protein